MNRVLVFFFGFIAGVVAVFITLAIFVFGDFLLFSRPDVGYTDYDGAEVVEVIPWDSDTVVAVVDEPEIDYIEVKGRAGYVNLYRGMTKAQVKDLLGRPTTTEIQYSTETWTYDFPGEGRYGTTRVMKIDFRDGGLSSISEY